MSISALTIIEVILSFTLFGILVVLAVMNAEIVDLKERLDFKTEYTDELQRQLMALRARLGASLVDYSITPAEHEYIDIPKQLKLIHSYLNVQYIPGFKEEDKLVKIKSTK